MTPVPTWLSRRAVDVLLMMVVATAIVVVGIRSVVGDVGRLLPGTSMACVWLADEGAFPSVVPGESPTWSSLEFPGRIVCVWDRGLTTAYDIIRFDALSIAVAGVGLLALVVLTARLWRRSGTVVGPRP